jgi:hypothetical protein
MGNRKKKSLIAVIIALLIGIGTINAIADHDMFFTYADPQKIDSQSAAKIATTKLRELGKFNQFVIEHVIEISEDESEKVLFYIFNLQPQGYIVVTADTRLPPIITYSFTSNFQSITSRYNPLLQMLKEDVQRRLIGISYLPEEVLEERKALWYKFIKGEPQNVGKKNFQQWPPEGTTSTGGWLESNWHQESPYNKFCPIDSETGERSVAGCPAVTMAQILNYHKNINNIMFNDDDDYYHNYGANQYWIDDDYDVYDFPSFPELNNYLVTLAHHYENQTAPTNDEKAALIFACGVAAQQVYTSEVSGTFGVNQAFQAYLRFGIDDINLIDENNPEVYGRLRMNIIDGLPAHLAVVVPDWSAGHNLVVDGYNTDDYYHLNFGWGGRWNGWYLLPDEMPFSLTVIEGILIDILHTNTGSNIFCDGRLHWSDVPPEGTMAGDFTVKNIGDNGSLLDWEIEEWPEWGIWTFTSLSGEDLTPEEQGITINLSVQVPDEKNKDLTGYIKVVNKNNMSDFFILPVSLATSINKHLNRIHFFETILQQFPILLHILSLLQTY